MADDARQIGRLEGDASACASDRAQVRAGDNSAVAHASAKPCCTGHMTAGSSRRGRTPDARLSAAMTRSATETLDDDATGRAPHVADARRHRDALFATSTHAVAPAARRGRTPIELVAKFELVINLNAARCFGRRSRWHLSLAPTRSCDEGPARWTALQRETVVNHWLTIQAIRL